MNRYIKWNIILVIIIGMIIFAGYNFFNHYDVTRTIKYGEINDSIKYKGVFIFDEVAIKSESYGNIQYYYKSGQRVRKGVELFSIGQSKSKALNSKNMQYDFDELTITELVRNVESSEIQDIKELKNELMNKRYKKQRVTNVLNLQEDIVSKNLISHSKYSQTAGIFSSYSDQLESYYTLDNIENIDFDRQSEMINIRDIGTVEKNETIGRTVNNYKTYLAFEITKEEKDIFKLNGRKTIRVNSNEELSGIVYKLIEKKNKVIVIMKFDKFIYKIVNQRKLLFEVLITHEVGLLIPKTAVVEKEGELGVYVENIDQTYSFKAVKKIKENEVNMVIEENYFKLDGEIHRTVKLYDDVLIDANNISHYKVR